MVPREKYLDRLWQMMSLRHILILTGVRRSGKSTLMQQMVGRLLAEGAPPHNVLFLYFDDLLVRPYLDRGADLPGGNLRLGFLALYVVLVLLVGSVVTYFVVPLPTGAGSTRRTRTPWSLALGLFAAVPLAYLVLVVLHEIVKPFLV